MTKRQRAERCEAGSPALLTLEEHAYQLYSLTTPDGFGYSAQAGVDRWLILTAGLSEVSVVTNGLDPQDIYCSNIFEEARGHAVSAVATELTRLLFIWGAVECLMRDVLPPRGGAMRARPSGSVDLWTAALWRCHTTSARPGIS